MLYYNSELFPQHQKQAVFMSRGKKSDLSSQSFTFHVLQTDIDHPRLCWGFFGCCCFFLICYWLKTANKGSVQSRLFLSGGEKMLFWHHGSEWAACGSYSMCSPGMTNFLPFSWGECSGKRKKCIREAKKIHLYKLAPLLWNFQLYISNYGCQLMNWEKTFFVPPPFFVSSSSLLLEWL